MVLITRVTRAYKPTYNWGGSHCTYIYTHIDIYLGVDLKPDCVPSFHGHCNRKLEVKLLDVKISDPTMLHQHLKLGMALSPIGENMRF